MLTIDANIWVNAITPSERNHASSRDFLMKVSTVGILVVVPTLLRVEIAGALSRTSATPRTVQDFSKVIASFSLIRWIVLDEHFAEVAANIATKHHLRGADAVYAAVAFENQCQLVSLDNEHLTRLSGTVNVLTPDEATIQLSKGV